MKTIAVQVDWRSDDKGFALAVVSENAGRREIVSRTFVAQHETTQETITKLRALIDLLETQLRQEKSAEQLMQFYNVSTLDDLVLAQMNHVAKLQATLEGMRPAKPVFNPAPRER